jgi:hypothetical protein
MIVREIRTEERDGKVWVCGSVTCADNRRSSFTLKWGVSYGETGILAATGDPFLAALLLPAMRLREDLIIEAAVSPTLLANAQKIMDIYVAWVTDVRRVSIASQRVTEPAPARPGSKGLFFSCGVDSFYSLLKDLDRSGGHESSHESISHLVLVHGFDIALKNRALFELIAAGARAVAESTGRKLLIVESNVRYFSDGLVPWRFYHGGVLASVGLVLGGLLGRCVIPSSHAYSELLPWGSDPMLDPLWSTESLEFIHDGCEALRTQKIKRLADSPLALDHLRVCWPDWTEDYNCGRCEKCVRTMIVLHAMGVLQRSKTFPNQLDPRAIRKVELVTGESGVGFMEDLLSVLGDTPVDRQVARAVRHVVSKARWRGRASTALDTFPRGRTALNGLRRTFSRTIGGRSPVAAPWPTDHRG